MKKIALTLGLTSILTGCVQAPIQLPSNVTTVNMKATGKQTQIDKVDGSFSVSKDVTFKNLSLCAAEVFPNNGQTLTDSNGSFFGAYSGNFYQKNNSQQVAANERVKYSDESTKTLIIHGTAETKPAMVVDLIQYDVKIQGTQDEIKLVFQNILRAQKNTGGVVNDGFNPVGTWVGARSESVIAVLNGLANKYKSCIES